MVRWAIGIKVDLHVTLNSNKDYILQFFENPWCICTFYDKGNQVARCWRVCPYLGLLHAQHGITAVICLNEEYCD